MGKITNKQRRTLDLIRMDLIRVNKFIQGKDIAVCRRSILATTSKHYTRKDSEHDVLYEIDKTLGSDLVFLESAIDQLNRFLFYTTNPDREEK